jgi:hypothetical protein
MNAVQWWRRQYRIAKDLTRRRTGVYGGPASDRIGDAMVRHIRAVVPVLRAFPTRTVRVREYSHPVLLPPGSRFDIKLSFGPAVSNDTDAPPVRVPLLGRYEGPIDAPRGVPDGQWPATASTVTLTDAAGRTASFTTLAAEIRDIVPNIVPRAKPLFTPETHEFKVEPLDYSIPLRWEFTAVMVDPIINLRGEVAE